RRPVVLLGIEVQRYGLGDKVATLLGRLNLPWTTTLLAKAVVAETTPGFFGVYDGVSAPKIGHAIVDRADVVLALGCMFGVEDVSLVSGSSTKFIRVAEGEARFEPASGGGAGTRKVDLAALIAELNGRTIGPGPNWETRPKLTDLSFDG